MVPQTRTNGDDRMVQTIIFRTPPGCRGDADGVVDGSLIRFGFYGGAHVQSVVVGTVEGRGETLLAVEDRAHGGPIGMLMNGA